MVAHTQVTSVLHGDTRKNKKLLMPKFKLKLITKNTAVRDFPFYNLIVTKVVFITAFHRGFKNNTIGLGQVFSKDYLQGCYLPTSQQMFRQKHKKQVDRELYFKSIILQNVKIQLSQTFKLTRVFCG